MTIAVLCQYPVPLSQLALSPMAFTIDDTHDGPPPSLTFAWSEFLTRGNYPSNRSQLAVGYVE